MRLDITKLVALIECSKSEKSKIQHGSFVISYFISIGLMRTAKSFEKNTTAIRTTWQYSN